MSTYGLYALTVGSDRIRQITDQRIDPGITEMLVSGDGGLDAEHVSVTSRRPIVRFSTTEIGQALAIAGVGGLVIDQAVSSNGVDLYFARKAAGGGYAPGGAHIKMTVDLGLLYPVNLRASHEAADPATIDYELMALGVDADNAPLSLAKDQGLGDLEPAINEVYTVGPWYVNSSLIDRIQEFNLAFGLEAAAPSGSGAIWPTEGFFRRRAASMTCTSLDLPALDAALIGIGGVARSSVTRAFLRQKKNANENWADNESKHPKFDIAEGRINPTEFGGTHQEDATSGLLVTPSHDGTNAPIAYTANSTIGV